MGPSRHAGERVGVGGGLVRGLSGGAVTDPAGPGSGSRRVARGGSNANFARHCHSAVRVQNSPGFRVDGLGFRLLREE